MRPQQMQFIHLTTLNAVNQLYQNDPSVLIPFLHPDVTWIRSRDNLCLSGKDSVSAALSAFLFTLPVSPVTLSCRILYSDRSSCTLLCTCNAGYRQKHCITFVWKLEQDRPRILHIHGSITPSSPSADTPETLPDKQRAEPYLVFTGQRAERYYLQARDILYVEADNICSRLICKNRILYICQPLSTVRELLPDSFLRIHRSFLVNVDYITCLRRYTVELQNGVTLPVPEKKYKWLREYLDQYRGHPGL